MCGIAGIIGHPREKAIEKMLQRQAHRGPDGLFYYRNDRIAWGHARLRIIDLSDQANQPMVDPQTGNVLVFNGEIYNYKELRVKLAHQYSFVTESDSEVLLAAYACNGIECLQQLRGMFAFALYDARQQQTLIVRDRFGIKPLYYRTSKDAFYFASEIKSLLGIDGLPAESINELKAYEFMANCQLDTNEQTLFNDVEQLLPANYVWVDQHGQPSEPVTYWSFPEPGHKLFDQQAEQELVSQFDECMSLHLRSDVPVGGFFSGGLDSGSVMAFAMRHDAQKIWP
ncbi:MAG: asparagine synthetase B family protein, partial [Ferruginibacter sp.]